MTSLNETETTQAQKPVSKAGWLVVAFIVFVLGSVVCGTGSIVVVFFAAVLSLPPVLSKRRAESLFGILLLLLCLKVGTSIYSEGGWGPYWDYLQRARVESTIHYLLEALKSPVETFYAKQHACPMPAQVGVTTSKYVVNILRSSASGEKCTYTAILKTKVGFATSITELELTYLVDSNSWSCKGKDTASTQINPIYLPHRCRG